ncbi:MAG TPA: M23 family metallopeptidase [Methylomirabilota bacterium]|jgi:murein DD-endopeptidase MepM/ murein hydrolase activator NlpD|nr:M23 family metallopeptidase [Methylomirabilota bacterium]
MIGLGVLLPSLLLAHPLVSSADGKPTRSSAKRLAPTHRKDVTNAAARGSERCVHVVRRGESLSRIAAQHRVTRQSIVAANGLAQPGALRVGQSLEIVGCKPALARRLAQPDGAIIAADAGAPLVARVGPRRIPTRLYLATPEWDDATPEFRWPVEGLIASPFGRRRGGWHAGVDIQADMGTPIRAAAAGTIVWSGWERFYGHMVKLQHEGGFVSVYAHNLENLVEVGDQVEAGAVIATVGRSGRASASHLHFEIRREGMAYNPLHLFEARELPLLASASSTPLDDDEDRE